MMMNRIIPLAVFAISAMFFLSAKTNPTQEKETLEYTIVYGDDLLTFQRRVDEKLNEGWQLQGGVSVGPKYFQAAVRTKVESEDSGD